MKRCVKHETERKMSLSHGPARGVALAGVMLLLLVITIIGVVSLRMAKEQQTMSGNLKELTKAQFAAEEAVRTAIDLPIWDVDDDPNNVNWVYTGTGTETDYSYQYQITHKTAQGAVVTDGEGFNYYIVEAQGDAGNARRQVEVAVVALFDSETLFDEAFIGCNGVGIESNATMSSYREDGVATDGANAQVRTLVENQDVRIETGTIIAGEVRTTGNLLVDEGATVAKDAYANGTIGVGNGGTIFGNAYAGGNITTQGNGAINGQTNANLSTPPVDAEECDPLGVVDYIADEGAPIASSNNNAEYGLSTSFSDNSGTTTIGTDGQAKDFYFTDFATSSNANVVIRGDVRFYVNGPMSILQNSGMEFAPGAKLTVYITGQYTMSSNSYANKVLGGAAMGDPKNHQIFSSAENLSAVTNNNLAMVNIESNGGFSGLVYAPFAHVVFSSNSTPMAQGAVRGRWADMESNTQFRYDETLSQFTEVTNDIDLGYKIVYWTEAPYEAYTALNVVSSSTSSTSTSSTSSTSTTTVATTTTTTSTTAATTTAATTTTTNLNPPFEETDFRCRARNNIVDIENTGAQACTISAIDVSWPFLNGNLNSVKLGNKTIYNTEETCCTASLSGFDPADASVDALQTGTLTFNYSGTAGDGNYNIVITASCGDTVIEQPSCVR